MNRKDTDQSDFARQLNDYLSPSNPVRREELLKGRTRQMKQIGRAMAVRGRSIFVWGPRGVGKTSVAQTAAFAHHPAKSDPILLSCDRKTTASKLIVNLVEGLLQRRALTDRTKTTVSKKINVKVIEGGVTTENTQESILPPTTVHDAARLIREAVEQWQAGVNDHIPVVVIDEFDLLGEATDRHFFGDLIKQVGDLDIPLHLIFCGVSRSLADLLEGHASAHRYIESIELERLPLEAGMDILRTAGEALKARFHDDHLFRIAQISDGFPYYVHLIGSTILWEKYEDSRSKADVIQTYYETGLKTAVESCDATLRQLYEKATRKYTEGYDHVLWAAAANPQLERRSTDIFEDFQRIERIRLRDPSHVPDRALFNQKINRLKTDTHGNVLIGNRQGWYEFRIPLLRGYCRLMAQNEGVDLGAEYPISKPFKH